MDVKQAFAELRALPSNEGKSDQDLLAAAPEYIQWKASQGQPQQQGQGAGAWINDKWKQHITPAVDATSRGIGKVFEHIANTGSMAQDMGLDTQAAGAEAGAMVNPLNAVRTPTDAAITGTTMATGGLGGVAGTAAKIAAPALAGAATDWGTGNGSPSGGAAQGAVAGVLSGLFRHGMTPQESTTIWNTVEKAAPWLKGFRDKWGDSQVSLRKLASWGSKDIPGSPAHIVGKLMDGVEDAVKNIAVAGKRVGEMVWDVPMAWDVNAGVARGKQITQGVNGAVSVRIDKALDMIRAAKSSPDEAVQSAAYAAEKSLVEQLRSTLGTASPELNALLEGSTQFRASAEATRIMADALKLSNQPPAVPGASFGGKGVYIRESLKDLLPSEREISIRKIQQVVKSPQKPGELGGGLRFDEHQPMHTPYFEMTSGALSKVPAMLGAEAANAVSPSRTPDMNIESEGIPRVVPQ